MSGRRRTVNTNMSYQCDTCGDEDRAGFICSGCEAEKKEKAFDEGRLEGRRELQEEIDQEKET